MFANWVSKVIALLSLVVLPAFGQGFDFGDQPYLSQASSLGGLLSGLVASWSFDEVVNSGTRADATANAYSLIDSNSNVGSLRAVIGGAAWFTNGAGHYLLHADNADLGFGASVSKTIAFWYIGSAGGGSSQVGEFTPGGAIDYTFDATGTFTCKDLGGTQRAISGTAAANSTWHFVVFGYDNANGVMFISSDGGVKTTAAISGIQKTGKAFVVGWFGGGIDELDVWNRALSTTEITQLYNGNFGVHYPFTVTDKGANIATNFNWAVVKNGGASPGATTLSAIQNLADGMVTDGTWTKVGWMLCYASDNLTACRTWLKLGSYKLSGDNTTLYIPLNEPVVNNSFVSGDLTINGLTGDGLTKYLSCYNSANGVNASEEFPSAVDGGFFLYAYTAASAAAVDFGIADTLNTVSSSALIAVNLTGVGAVAHFGNAAISVGTNAPTPGFFSVQRSSSTQIDMYYAASTFSHASISQSATTSTASSITRGQNFDLFAYNDAAGGGEGTAKSANTISFFGTNPAHLSSSDDALVYNRVQAFLVAKGGGFR